ncbi:acyltransferase [Dyella solisilvae]|uniref:Acyltransferase n=1 Tax=Dyella solisilvae TaxID=1920168 RepID=A0A370K7H2_9GAMM|nr:acyltransferase family protein [Dyella solisilvae]RDI98574.1 acyltransferase [Dyella solisilvae]
MNRRHDIDALRVLAFGLLILYHAGMLYVAPVDDWGYNLKSGYLAEWLQYPMLFLNRWRMELLFLISGLAVHFLRGRLKLPALAWKRTVRLLLPLAFGMLVVIPIQPYTQAVTEHAVASGFLAFLPHYWTHGYRDYGLTWSHLWYLPYVWLYTMVLLMAVPALESGVGQRLRAGLQRLHGAALVLAPALPLLLAGTLRHHHPETHALVGDWYAHALYFTMFLYGYLLGVSHGLWAELARLRRASLGMALACFALYLFLDKFASALLHRPLTHATVVAAGWLIEALRYTYGWTAIAAILGFAHVYLNRPFRWLPYAREAVFPWYVLHQSVMLAVAFWLIPRKLGPVLEPALVLAGTVAGCALLHECVIRRVRWLRPLFGIDAVPRARIAATSPALTGQAQEA